MPDKGSGKRTIRIGSRESKLAVIQSRLVMDYIENNYEDIDVSLVTMRTTGDKILDRTLDEIGGKGLFVKELDRALLDGRSDLSVHSLKDMPMEIPEELPIVAYSAREDARDVLVLPEGASEPDFSLPVGCSSRRRMLQFKALYPEAQFKSVRGNVLTRLEKLDRGEYGCLVLAAAGLKRLGLENRISRYFEPEEMIPSAGQGILAVQGRSDTDYGFLVDYDDEESRICALSERAFVETLDGGCSSPVAAYSFCKGEEIEIRGLYYSEEQECYVTGSVRGLREDGEKMAKSLAAELRDKLEG
ncbi:MAG: hydroxymethylbilane synthase [Firmicutes bacterium]|nr:hydroxymethylbilane synthase [Bacillota bacterium]